MKGKPTYLFILLPILIISCTKTPKTVITAPPLGVFTGQFVGLHKSNVYANYDTLKANLQLTLSTATGFTVLGDTSKAHAGSYGSFSVNATTITFYDLTYPLSGYPKKIHLAGSYVYSFDGTNFEFFASNDTLTVDYKFKKTGN